MGSQAPLPAQKPFYGWVLLAVSWVLRMVGVVATLAMVGTWSVPDWTWKGILFGTSFVGIAFAVTGLELGKYAHRLLEPTAESPSSLAPWPYVLYLRPFSLDPIMDELEPVYASTPRSLFIPSGQTREQRLARGVHEFGRLVTVGRPGELLPRGSGARRMYIPAVGWEPIVAGWISDAELVILGAGPGKGTVREYVQVLRRGDPLRFIILVTDTARYQNFRELAMTAASEAFAELQALHGSSFQVPDLPDVPPPAKPKLGEHPSYLQAVVFFDADWKTDLEFFRTTNARAAMDPVLARVRAGVQANGRSS